MIILAIETSCDDTGVALVKPSGKKWPKFKILSNLVSSQVEIHKKYGGVYPALAKREHQKNLPVVLKKALKRAKLLLEKIDLIAVTVGPGLEPCLWTGVNFAKELAKKLNLPIAPVNHIEAHILANWLPPVGSNSEPRSSEAKGEKRFFSLSSNFQNIFPAICLVVSGGHTQLILIKDFGEYKILGETRDDAAGECFDKTARVLGLGYPGGPAIEATAAKLRTISENRGLSSVSLPRPMIYQKNYDFSFSGLKTAVLYHYKNQSPKIRKSEVYIREMAKEIQQAIIDVLIYKTLKAVKEYKAKSIILGGGVVANNELRKQFQSAINNQQLSSAIAKRSERRGRSRLRTLAIKFLVPPKKFSTDNAAMVAIAGYYNWFKNKKRKWSNSKVEANANLRLK